MSDDFLDLIREFLEAGVEFVIVGAHALAVHGVVRATGDLDLLVRASPENAARVYAALSAFGAPLRAHGLEAADFARRGTVYQMGLPPRRIDVLTQISGPDFDLIRDRQVHTTIAGLRVPVIGRDDFIANKLASGRTKDLQDIELLRAAEAPPPRRP